MTKKKRKKRNLAAEYALTLDNKFYIVIKYDNRKLYDPKRSMYIKLKDVIDLYRKEDIIVLEAFTGRNLTNETVISAIFQKVSLVPELQLKFIDINMELI